MQFWQICLILTIIFNVVFTQYYKKATNKSSKDGALTFLIQCICAATVLISIPFFKIQFPTDIRIWAFFGLSIIFYTIADRIQTPVKRNLEASVSAIVGQLFNVFMILWGLIFFKEEAVLLKILGGGLIIFCNAMLFYEKGKFKLTKYAWLGVLQNLFVSIAMSFDVGISENFNLGIYIAIAFFAPAMLIKTFERIKFKEVKEEFAQGDMKAIVITGISWGLMALFNLLAYTKGGEITKVAPLVATTVLFNVVVSYIFLKERTNLTKKLVSAIGIIISIILIAIV